MCMQARLAFDGWNGHQLSFIKAKRRDNDRELKRKNIIMTLPRTSGLFSEFQRHAVQATSEETFRAQFAKFSRNADRPGMITLVSNALKKFDQPINDVFQGKDEAKAIELLNTAEKNENVLSEALATAPTKSQLFFNILVERARFWYRNGDLARCLADCKFFADIIEMKSISEEKRIDMLLLHSDVCKAMSANDEARNLLNEAMKLINSLAAEQCGKKDETSDAFRMKKGELLKKILQRKQTLPEKQIIKITNNKVEKKIPSLEGKPNEFLRSCSDAVALSYDKSKGRLLYATRNIKPGSVLIVDKPFSYSTDLIALRRNCLNCHNSLRLDGSIKVPCETCQTVQFCSEKCRQKAWDTFHKYECRVFDCFSEIRLQKTNSLLAYRTVITAALNENSALDEEFLRLHENDNSKIKIESLKRYEPQDYKTVFSLETHCAQSDPKDNLERAIHSIFLSKCLIYSLNLVNPETDNHERHLDILAVALLRSMQAINCNAYEIVENLRDDETKILGPRNVGGAIYSSVSLTNHSCYPNIVRHSFPCGTVVVTSIRFIPQGGEILDCYGQHFLENKRDTRRKQLFRKYHFDCQCEACESDWPLTLPSDQFNFKCKKCAKQCRRTRTSAECTECGQKTDINKLYTMLQSSIKKRLSALTKMYDDNYPDALPLLLEHANCIDKILTEPNLEAVKTQQSIIQCLNAMSSTSV